MRLLFIYVLTAAAFALPAAVPTHASATLMDTTLVTGLGIPARTTVAEGRDRVIALITAPFLQPGAFYVDGRVATPHAQAADAEARTRLVALSEELTGVPLE